MGRGVNQGLSSFGGLGYDWIGLILSSYSSPPIIYKRLTLPKKIIPIPNDILLTFLQQRFVYTGDFGVGV